MKLYLLRHAIAAERGEGTYPDDDRPLTEEGIKKMEKAAQGMVALGLDVEKILTSPLVRAAETARIAAQALDATDRLKPCEALRPGKPPQALFSELARAKDTQSVLLVGHEPDLSGLAATLLHAPQLLIRFKKGGLCAIEIPNHPPSAPGTLLWHVTPEQLRLMGRK